MRATLPLLLACTAWIATEARSDTWLNESDEPLECDFCNLQLPLAVQVDAGEEFQVYGRLFEAGVTEPAGAPGGVLVQAGFGPPFSNPTASTTWTWFFASWDAQLGNDDQFVATLRIRNGGFYAYAYRFSLDGGATFSAGDLDGAGSNAGLDFSVNQLGVATVVPEPAGALLGGAAAASLLGVRRARRSGRSDRRAGDCVRRRRASPRPRAARPAPPGRAGGPRLR
jgi:hypothetical protein